VREGNGRERRCSRRGGACEGEAEKVIWMHKYISSEYRWRDGSESERGRDTEGERLLEKEMKER
jgi:hypothetical protein